MNQKIIHELATELYSRLAGRYVHETTDIIRDFLNENLEIYGQDTSLSMELLDFYDEKRIEDIQEHEKQAVATSIGRRIFEEGDFLHEEIDGSEELPFCKTDRYQVIVLKRR
jgi:hypothetical protein